MAQTTAIGLIRVSTDRQGESGLGLEAQRAKVEAQALVGDLNLIEIIEESGVSGGREIAKRKGLGNALAMLEAGEAEALIVPSLSRLSRRTRDVLEIADRADKQGWALIVMDLAMDTRTPTGKLAMTVLAAVAELEREQISERTRDAMAAAKAQGRHLGRKPTEGTLIAGRRVIELREQGMTWREICRTLDAEGLEPRNKGKWQTSSARRAADAVRLDAELAANRAA